MFGYFLNLGPWEMALILGLAVLLFGKRLPEVGRSVGKSIVEFKKGMRGVEEEINRVSYSTESSSSHTVTTSEESESPTAPKFEPPAAETQEARTE